MVGRKWLLIEAIVCMLPAVILLILAFPLICLGIVELISPITIEKRSITDRFLAIAPYVAGIFGVFRLWRSTLQVIDGENIPFDPLLVVAVLAGMLASHELLLIAPIMVQVGVLLPLWGFVLHLFLLSVKK